jgi:hypothetical protein
MSKALHVAKEIPREAVKFHFEVVFWFQAKLTIIFIGLDEKRAWRSHGRIVRINPATGCSNLNGKAISIPLLISCELYMRDCKSSQVVSMKNITSSNTFSRSGRG